MRECFHPEKWRNTEECGECRFRSALEKICAMSVRTYNPTTKEGKMFDAVVEVAWAALHPEQKVDKGIQK